MKTIEEFIVKGNNKPSNDEWIFSSADLLTLTKGYCLDAVYVFDELIDINIFKKGLSKTLDLYPTFSGRVAKSRDKIILNNEGAKVIIAEDDTYTLDDVINNHNNISNEFVDYSSVLKLMFFEAPITVIKITKLNKSNASVVAIYASHGVCDGATYYTFVQHLGKMIQDEYKNNDNNLNLIKENNEIPVINQDLIPYKNRRTKSETYNEIQKEKWETINIPQAVVGLSKVAVNDNLLLHHSERSKPKHFNKDTLKRIKKAALKDLKENASQYKVDFLTTNEALSAFLAQTMVSLFEFDDTQKMGHSTMVNSRERLPNLPTNFAGNASFAMKSCEFLASSTLGEIASKMHKGFLPFKNDKNYIVDQFNLFLDVHHHEIIAHQADPSTLPYLNSAPTTVVTNNFAGYPIYDAKFTKSGKSPKLVVPHFAGDQIVIFPAPNNDGVYIYFQGTTSKKIKTLADDDHFFKELSKFDNDKIFENKNKYTTRTNGSLIYNLAIPMKRKIKTTNSSNNNFAKLTNLIMLILLILILL